MKNMTFRIHTLVAALSCLGWLAAHDAQAAPASPAERQIESAQAALAKQPDSVKSLDSLAVGLTRRARETGDVAYYQKAADALEKAERLQPGNQQTLRISAWVAMGRHEFAQAWRIARHYDRLYPHDPWNLSVMGDALMELGRYRDAERAFQQMVDLKPGPAACTRVAYLRETRGDLQGALEMMRLALASTDSREREDRAWILVQIAHLQEIMGDLEGSEGSYHDALNGFAGYHYALAGLAEVSLREGRADEAAAYAAQSIQAAPHAERYLLLADAQRELGKEDEARLSESTFERLALENVGKADNENHDLVLYYLQRRPNFSRALAVARQEVRRRRDIHTMDRLAVALAAQGHTGEAKRILRRVLEVGTRDPLVRAHAAALQIPHAL